MKLPTVLRSKDVPKHLAVSATRIKAWSENNKIPLNEATNRNISKIFELIDIQVKKEIPLLSIQLSTQTKEEIESLKNLFRRLSESDEIKDNKIRIYAIGDWYSIDNELSDEINNCLDKTSEYDHFFLNFCINYDGQKEILASFKLLLRKALAEKIKTEDLMVEDIKQNLATSYFIPPDLIIESGGRYSGLLLWDSKGASMYYTNKYWLDFEKSDFEKALDFFNKNKKEQTKEGQ